MKKTTISLLILFALCGAITAQNDGTALRIHHKGDITHHIMLSDIDSLTISDEERTVSGEGLAVISKDASGRSHLAFMPLSEEAAANSFYEYDCFSANNPGLAFASNVADIVSRGAYIYLACQGSGQDGDSPTIYYLNRETFEVEQLITAPEYEDFEPVCLALPAGNTETTGLFPVLCTNGRTYDFSPWEGVIDRPEKLTYTYSTTCVINTRTNNSYELLFWDKEIGELALIYNGYGPYYCSQTYQTSREQCADGSNYFNGKDLVTMTLIRQTPAQRAAGASRMLAVAKNDVALYKVVLNTQFHVYDAADGTLLLDDGSGWKLCGVGNTSPLEPTTPCIANATYATLLFANANKVMQWHYSVGEMLGKANELLTVGSESAVITSFELSEDHKKTYVAFYEPEQNGMNGSVWVFDTDSGVVLEKYNNVCYRPVKMLFK